MAKCRQGQSHSGEEVDNVPGVAGCLAHPIKPHTTASYLPQNLSICPKRSFQKMSALGGWDHGCPVCGGIPSA